MFSTILCGLLLVFLNLTANVNSQTCQGMSPYGSCSSNNACGCLPLSFADDIGICALVGVSCSRLSPCRSSDDTCEKADHICVLHPRCDSRPLCYPMSMMDQRLCPFTTTSTPPPFLTTVTRTTPTTTTSRAYIISNYSSALTYNSEAYSRNGNFTSDYYYEAIEVIVNTTGTYTFSSLTNMDAYGFLYTSDFNSSDPLINLLTEDDQSGGNNQFRFSAVLEAGVPYTLVFTTYRQRETGPFTVLASGPDDVYFSLINNNQTTSIVSNSTISMPFVISNYSSEFTYNSERYPGLNKHYQAIEIIVNTTGTYNIRSLSNMDTIGYLYEGQFDPSNVSLNLIADNDDYQGNNQFYISAYLQAGVRYTLIVTTFGQALITGPFSVIVSGPDYVNFNQTDAVQTTYMTSTSTTSQPFVVSNYSNILTVNSETYNRDNNSTSTYYQAIEIMVNTTGSYDLLSEGNMDAYGCLYRHRFIPSEPTYYQLTCDDDGAGGGQFKLTYHLQAGVQYILVFTTFSPSSTGPFSIIGYGPDNVDFTPIGVLQTTSIPSTSTTSPFVISSYSNTLTNDSQTYNRNGNSASNDYYYQAIQLVVNATGTYTFTSRSVIDTYGYIYQGNFYPSDPSLNMLERDDDNGGDRQFRLTSLLRSDLTYVLVFTTFSQYTTGPFSIVASGPDSVEFIAIST